MNVKGKLTKKQIEANEKFLIWIVNNTKQWLWPDEGNFMK